ncbi:g3481 [Coccomyxa viridis]|uniref:G3481 protein n=1 Tax=Coccomyxa viridis TaxID=1274662 RepID=A0ABP1FMW8_9CHLO
MDMPSGPDTRKLPSGRTAAEVFGRDLHGSSSRPPSAASANTSSLAEDKENVPGRHQNIPRIPRASMGRKLDFSSQRTSEPAAGSTPSDPASEASPIFSPMQMDSQPRVPVPPVPSFLKQRAQANMGMGSTQQPQGSAGSEPGSSLSSGSSPSVPNVPGVLSSSVTALQHLAGRAAQEAAASRGADEETAMQVKNALRASMSAAARAAAAKEPSGTLPQGSALLWALLQHCLKQQAEALIEQHSYKAAAKEAMAQASKNQQDGEELIRKAQKYIRDTKAHAKKSAAAAESTAQQLAAAQETLRHREEELAATSARVQSAEAKARTAQLEAAQAQAALNEVLAARRGGREALTEMASQNARLVVGYCAKKAELKRIQEALAAERARWEARLQRLESGQYTGASGCRSARKTCSLMEDGLEPSACAMSGEGARMKDGAQQEVSWKAEREKLCRDKMALQRECRQLLERLQELQGQDARPSSAGSPQILGSGLTREASAASSELSAATDAEAEIRRLTEENSELRRQTEEAQERSTAAERRQQAEQHKQAGNARFQQGDNSRAAEEYKAGLAVAQPDQAPLKAVLHCNHAAAMHALGQHTEAIADCCAAIALDASYLKAYQRRAEAAMALGDTAAAVQDLSFAASKGLVGAHQKLMAAQRSARAESLPNYYAVLGVDKSASPAAIRTAFRQLALRFHPDKASGPGQKEAAEKLFRLVSDAHSTLSDPDKRRLYDLDTMRKEIQARARSPRFR